MKGLVKAMFTAAGLAVWSVFGQPAYNAWLEAQGRSVGFAETWLGYFITLGISWVVALIVSRRMSEGE